MESVLFRRSLVIGILILFVGASILPSIGGSYIETNNENINYEKNSTFLFFTENKGQFPDEVLYQVNTPMATVYFCTEKIVTVFSKSSADESEVEILSTVTSWIGSNKNVNIQAENILPHHHNYYIGNKPDKWYTDVPNYASLVYYHIYQGIDLRYYFNENSLKYDFILSPGADPSDIQIEYEGINNLFLTPSGDIKIDTNFGSIFENKPFIYQEINGVKRKIYGKYRTIEPNVFGFEIDDYTNPSFPIVIDPILKYSSYLGGNNYDVGEEIAADSSGNVYIIGHTDSTNYPTQNPYQGTLAAFTDAFITKLHPSTNTLVYSTYLGGNNFDYGTSIDIDSGGFASIVGTTYSNNLPVFAAHFPNLNGIQDAFVARLNPSGEFFLQFLARASSTDPSYRLSPLNISPFSIFSQCLIIDSIILASFRPLSTARLCSGIIPNLSENRQ